MPIQVHCPNPVCARLHLVKSKYAGMRGKCPACLSWMYVPRTVDVASSHLEPRPPALAAAAAAKASPGRPISLSDVSEIDEVEVLPPADDRPAKKKPARKADPDAEADDAPAEKPSPKRFSRVAAVLLFLAVLGLGAVAASPYLEGPKVEATGGFAGRFGNRKLDGFSPEILPLVTYVPAGIGGFILLMTLVGLLVGGRARFLMLFFFWLALVATSVVLAVASHFHFNEVRSQKQLEVAVTTLREKENREGDVKITSGLQLAAALYGSAAAAGCLLLAILFLQKRTLSRLFTFVVLGVVVALGPVWVWRYQLGIAGYFGEDIEKWLVGM